jgi:hypothetical protein
MKYLIYITVIVNNFSTSKLHSAWINKDECINECKRLKSIKIDSFFVIESHNYTNGQKFINL